MECRRWILATAALALVAPITGTAQQGRGGMTAERRAEMMARQAEALLADMRMERPIEALNSVWIEELTWMEVRDALRDGKTTAIISTGGIEQNGPYLATGKHNYVLEGACEGIARKLGNALCAPVIKLVPEGGIDNPSGHMRYPGTISLREETFRAVLTDVGRQPARPWLHQHRLHRRQRREPGWDGGGGGRAERTVARGCARALRPRVLPLPAKSSSGWRASWGSPSPPTTASTTTS